MLSLTITELPVNDLTQNYGHQTTPATITTTTVLKQNHPSSNTYEVVEGQDAQGAEDIRNMDRGEHLLSRTPPYP